MMSCARALMERAKAVYGPDVDHTDTSRLAEEANGVRFIEAAARDKPLGDGAAEL